eukprot:scaffold39883_cov36-Tisochrysis_lutea.AAC.1
MQLPLLVAAQEARVGAKGDGEGARRCGTHGVLRVASMPLLGPLTGGQSWVAAVGGCHLQWKVDAPLAAPGLLGARDGEVVRRDSRLLHI